MNAEIIQINNYRKPKLVSYSHERIMREYRRIYEEEARKHDAEFLREMIWMKDRLTPQESVKENKFMFGWTCGWVMILVSGLVWWIKA